MTTTKQKTAIRETLERLDYLEAENESLKRQLREKETEAEETESLLTDEIVKLQDRLILAKSLINIPDNLEDCVRELIRERLKGWVNIAYEASGLAWLDSEETPCARFDLEKALNRPKGKGRKSAK